MARRNAVLKNLHSAEALGSVSVICSDKTGTLTKNEMTLREVVTASGRALLSGEGYDPAGSCEVTGDALPALVEIQTVLEGGALANNAQLARVNGAWEIQGDPTEAAFLVAQHKVPGVADRVAGFERIAQVPVTSERKLMSVVGVPDGMTGERMVTKGAPDVLLEHCTREQVGDRVFPLTPDRRERVDAVVLELNGRGYRTLGVAWRDVARAEDHDFDENGEHGLVFVGIVGILDPPRLEAITAVADAGRAGIRTVMITGDHPVTAMRIASELGVVSSFLPGRDSPSVDSQAVVTGAELDALDGPALVETTRGASVYARVTPEHKLRIVDALQSDRHIVAMTGDGVNDAPALKSADIGIAMGITGTEVTKEAATMILGDDNYATIVSAVRQGRVIFDNIRKFLRYLLISNMGEVATVFLGVVLGGVIGLVDPANPTATVVPLLATQILWINLITDSGPALAMGVDPEIDDVMARPPRRFDDRIIDSAMWARIVRVGLVMGLGCLLVFDLTLPGGLVGGFEHMVPVEEQLVTARTTVFTTLVLMQLANALNSRSETRSAFDRLFTNRWLWLSLAFTLVAQFLVVEVPFMQGAFGTTSLDAAHWGLAVAGGLLVLVVEEIVKVVHRAGASGLTRKA